MYATACQTVARACAADLTAAFVLCERFLHLASSDGDTLSRDDVARASTLQGLASILHKKQISIAMRLRSSAMPLAQPDTISIQGYRLGHQEAGPWDQNLHELRNHLQQCFKSRVFETKGLVPYPLSTE